MKQNSQGITGSVNAALFISALIVIQCVLFVWEGVSPGSDPQLIDQAQLIIDLLFLGEVILRIRQQGSVYFRSKLNLLDTVLVVASVANYFVLQGASGTLTILRLYRLFRLFRIMQLIPNADMILQGMNRSLKASRAVFLMLGVLISFFSILGYVLFSDVLPAYFANPVTAAYTVFSLFTVEGWAELPQAIAAGSPHYYLIRLYVISVIVIGSFLALSLANAIFIDEMVIDNNDQLESKIDQLTDIINAQSAQIEQLRHRLEISSPFQGEQEPAQPSEPALAQVITRINQGNG